MPQVRCTRRAAETPADGGAARRFPRLADRAAPACGTGKGRGKKSLFCTIFSPFFCEYS